MAGLWRSVQKGVVLSMAGAVLAIAVGVAPAADSGHGLEPVRDLGADARLARERGLPILMVVSQHHCPFCDLLREEVLLPMVRSGDYVDRVILRELFLDGEQQLRDFDGRSVGPEALADRYRTFLTPTLLFLDPRGKELTDRILGINTVEFYGYYLDASILEAYTRLNARGG